MVELKTSVYDEDNDVNPPIVHATEVDSTETDRLISVDAAPYEPPNDDPTSTSTPDDPSEESRTASAGIAAAVVGFLLGGPILSFIAGCGTAYASQQDGAAGDCARAVGDVAISVRKKAQELNEKHRLAEKGKKAAEDAWEQAKDVDRQHNLLEKTREVLVSSWKATVDFTREHNLIERSVEGVGKAIYLAAEKIAAAMEKRKIASENPNGNAAK